MLLPCISADSDLPVETWIEHNSMNLITVDGFQAPVYYVRKIIYDTTLAGLTEVIERSVSCQQEILYKCNNSRLMMQAEMGRKSVVVVGAGGGGVADLVLFSPPLGTTFCVAKQLDIIP